MILSYPPGGRGRAIMRTRVLGCCEMSRAYFYVEHYGMATTPGKSKKNRASCTYGGPEVHSRFPFLVSTFALICASRFPFVLICASRFPFLIPPSFVPRVSRSSSFVLRVSHFSFRPHLCLAFPVRPHLCFAFPISQSALIRAPNFSPPG